MNHKGFTLPELLINIGIVLCSALCIWYLSTLLIKGCSPVIDELQKQGLKSVVERIWKGEDKEDE